MAVNLGMRSFLGPVKTPVLTLLSVRSRSDFREQLRWYCSTSPFWDSVKVALWQDWQGASRTQTRLSGGARLNSHGVPAKNSPQSRFQAPRNFPEKGHIRTHGFRWGCARHCQLQNPWPHWGCGLPFKDSPRTDCTRPGRWPPHKRGRLTKSATALFTWVS